jgi:uncharacterized protein (TIGR02147 family)
MTIHTNLAKLLGDALEERCKRNPKYSLRAFARDLGVPAPRLSRWLKGEDGLSRTSAQQLAKRLGLSTAETESFVVAMESKYARAKKIRDNAKAKLLAISGQYASLDVEAFKVIADWYNLAVLSLVETNTFKPDATWISKRLGISVYEAKGALQRLTDLEMIESHEGSIRPTGVFFANPTGIPSQSVRSFHTQILEKAKIALQFQSTDQRDHSALILAVDGDEIEEAKLFIKKFREEFEFRFCRSDSNKNEVYALGVQFFSLTQKGEKNENQ